MAATAKKTGKAKITKGHYGYLTKRKRGLLLRAGILLLGIAGLVIISLVIFKTAKTWLSIIAAISAIPAAMLLATFFSIVKYKEPDRELYVEVSEIVGNGVLDCDIVIPNKDGLSFQFHFIYVHETGMYAYTPNEKMDLPKTAEYVRNYLRLNECDGSFTIYKDFSRYKNALKCLAPSDRESCDELLLRQEGVLRAITT